jgi:hypothetical protein
MITFVVLCEADKYMAVWFCEYLGERLWNGKRGMLLGEVGGLIICLPYALEISPYIVGIY